MTRAWRPKTHEEDMRTKNCKLVKEMNNGIVYLENRSTGERLYIIKPNVDTSGFTYGLDFGWLNGGEGEPKGGVGKSTN